MGVRLIGEKYYLDYYYQGDRVRESVGTNEKKAKQMMAVRTAEILTGKFKLPVEERTTFKVAVADYMKWAEKNKRSWIDDREMLNRVGRTWGEMPLSKISPWHVEKMKAQLTTEGLSPSRANRYLTCLSGLFHRAQEWGIFSGENPVKRVRKYREPPGKVRYLEQAEIARLLAQSEGPLKVLVTLALGTGMRRGEILALLWGDVDMVNGFLHVRNSKSGKGRDVPMGAEVRRCLEDLTERTTARAPAGPLFHRPEVKEVAPWVRHKWEKVTKAAGLPGVRFHDLRHTFASHLVMKGESLFALQELLGHSSLTMTRRYSHLAPGVLRKAVGAMDDLLTNETAPALRAVGP